MIYLEGTSLLVNDVIARLNSQVTITELISLLWDVDARLEFDFTFESANASRRDNSQINVKTGFGIWKAADFAEFLENEVLGKSFISHKGDYTLTVEEDTLISLDEQETTRILFAELLTNANCG